MLSNIFGVNDVGQNAPYSMIAQRSSVKFKSSRKIPKLYRDIELHSICCFHKIKTILDFGTKNLFETVLKTDAYGLISSKFSFLGMIAFTQRLFK